MIQSPYRKEWYVGTSIAKGFIGTPLGSRIPTITTYAETFSCSRGVVQNALALLENDRVIVLDKQGKMGTFLVEKNDRQLFHYSGLNHLTASMPPPLNRHFAGLATGICQGMSRCDVPFTFAFVQGSKNRIEALLSNSYDFVVTTQHVAEEYIEKYDNLEIAFPFSGAEYALPYKLYINKPNKTEIEDGMKVAIDPSSTDQVEITRRLCENKKVIIKEMPLMTANYAFYTGEIDCMVFRDAIQRDSESLLKFILNSDVKISPNQISEVQIEDDDLVGMQIPVVLINKDNYGMAGILKNYLSGDVVGYIQGQVLAGNMAPQFY